LLPGTSTDGTSRPRNGFNALEADPDGRKIARADQHIGIPYELGEPLCLAQIAVQVAERQQLQGGDDTWPEAASRLAIRVLGWVPALGGLGLGSLGL
jgi:hypothetical protein